MRPDDIVFFQTILRDRLRLSSGVNQSGLGIDNYLQFELIDCFGL